MCQQHQKGLRNVNIVNPEEENSPSDIMVFGAAINVIITTVASILNDVSFLENDQLRGRALRD